jgi:hypothetical protein
VIRFFNFIFVHWRNRMNHADFSRSCGGENLKVFIGTLSCLCFYV